MPSKEKLLLVNILVFFCVNIQVLYLAFFQLIYHVFKYSSKTLSVMVLKFPMDDYPMLIYSFPIRVKFLTAHPLH